MNFLGILCPIKKNRILFLSFGGRQFSDSPRALYEAMKNDSFFKDYEFIWAFNDIQYDHGCGAKIIKNDSIQYFLYALSSKIWITNTSICRGLQFKKKGNICINTWHGSPLKKMGDALDPNPKYKEKIDIACCQNDLDKSIFLRLFNVKEENVFQVDLPRNDELIHYSDEDIKNIRSQIGIPGGKKVIMYMPTYRDYNLDETNHNFFLPPVDFQKWEKTLGDDYVLLVRFHYLVEKMMVIPDSPFFYNVTAYEQLNDLYAITDILISDYSSAYIDFSILERPMLCYGYDFEEYKCWRGFELDFEKEMPCEIDKTEDELLDHLIHLDVTNATTLAMKFHKKYSPYAGHATESIIEILKERLSFDE